MALILHKRSSIAATVPTVGQIVDGELGMNTADGKLFMKKSDGSIVTFTQAAAIESVDGGFPSDTYSNIPIIDGGTP